MHHSLLNDVLDVVDDEPAQCAMVYLSIALRWQVNYKTASKFTFSSRESPLDLRLFTDQNFFGELTSLGLCKLALDSFQLLKDCFVVNLGCEADSEALAVGLSQLCSQLRQCDFLFLSKDARVVHLVLKNVFGDLNVFTLRSADHAVALVVSRMIVVRAREPVADLKLSLIPVWLVLLFLLVVVILLNLFRSFLEHVLDVPEDDVLDGAMVDLSELVWALSAQINDETSAEIVLNLDHVAREYTVLASKQVFGQLG